MRNRRKKAPRRAGLSCLWTRRARARRRSFCAQRRALAPKRIVYISCNPETQARDVEFLDSIGYAVVAVQPVDMFPHTDHIECIVALEPVDSLSPDRRGKEGGEEEAADAEADEAPRMIATGAPLTRPPTGKPRRGGSRRRFYRRCRR